VGGGGGFDLVGDHVGRDREEAVAPVVLRVERDDARRGAYPVHTELLARLEVDLQTGATGRFRAGDDVCEVDHVSAPFGLGDGVSTRCTRRTTRLQTYPVPPADRPPSIPISSRHDG